MRRIAVLFLTHSDFYSLQWRYFPLWISSLSPSFNLSVFTTLCLFSCVIPETKLKPELFFWEIQFRCSNSKTRVSVSQHCCRLQARPQPSYAWGKSNMAAATKVSFYFWSSEAPFCQDQLSPKTSFGLIFFPPGFLNLVWTSGYQSICKQGNE